MSQLYVVEVAVPMVVVAEDAFDACALAEAYVEAELKGASYTARPIDEVTDLPVGWEPTSIPYGAEADTSVVEYLAAAIGLGPDEPPLEAEGGADEPAESAVAGEGAGSGEDGAASTPGGAGSGDSGLGG